jgi:hypothetical protein
MLDPRYVRWSTRPSFEPGETELVGKYAGLIESTTIDYDFRFIDPLHLASVRVCRVLELRLNPPEAADTAAAEAPEKI